MGPSPTSWGIMENTTAIRRSNPLSLFMYVTCLTYYFGDFDEDMVVSLTILNMSDIENDSKFYFAVAYSGCLSDGRMNL